MVAARSRPRRIATWFARRWRRIAAAATRPAPRPSRQGMRARGTIIAKSDLVVAGIDVAAETFRQLDPTVGVRSALGRRLARAGGRNRRRRARRRARAARSRAHRAQFPSAVVRHRDADREVRRRRRAAASPFSTRARPRRDSARSRNTPSAAAAAPIIAMRLDDGILIKDNHKRLAGGVGAAAARAMKDSGGLPVEVEVENARRARRGAEDRRAAHPARQLHHLRHPRSGQARQRPRRDRDLRRRDARAHSRARDDRRAVRVDRRADAFRARGRSQLRARARRDDARRSRGARWRRCARGGPTRGSTCAGTPSTAVDDGCGVGAGARRRAARRGRRRRRADRRAAAGAGTTWASPPGAGLYFSFVARPAPDAILRCPLITLAAGVAVREGIAPRPVWRPI